jgi:hypothetical protein
VGFLFGILSPQADAAAVGNHEFSVTQSGVEVVQAPELSKDDRPLWLSVEAFDLAVFEFGKRRSMGQPFACPWSS